jgi:cytochrome c
LEIAQRKYTKEELITLIKEPQPKNWPDYPPMAPMQWVNGEELATIADWIASLEVNE